MKKAILISVTAMLLPLLAWAQKSSAASSTSDFFGCDVAWKYDEDTKTLTIRPNNGGENESQSWSTWTDIQVMALDESVNKLGNEDNWTYTKGVQKSFSECSGVYSSSIITYDDNLDVFGKDVLNQTYHFVDFIPTSGNITVGFNIPNTLDDTYDIYLVTCPMWLKDDYNNIPIEEWDVRPYRFTATVIERDDEGKNIGQFPASGKTLENPNPIDEKQKTIFLSKGIIYDKAGHIIVNDTTYLGEYQFKNACYGKGNYNVIIQIASSILSSQRKDFSNEMLISSIILKPHGNNASIGIQEDVEHVVLEEGVTKINYHFATRGLNKIKTVEIPNSLISIGDGAFQGCSGLTSVVIPDNVKNIGENAFSGCKYLTEVRLGSGLDLIQDGAFDGCPITRLYCYADYPPTATTGDADHTDSFYVVKANCKLYVKPESFDIYNVNPYWSQFNLLQIEETAVNQIEVTSDINTEWYTLDGIKLNGKPTEKGIYMNNGKKNYVK